MAWTNNTTNSALTSVPSSGGIGYKAWTSQKTTSINSGFFLGLSQAIDPIKAPDINSPAHNRSFGIYGHGVILNARAIRSFLDPLTAVGDEFTVLFTVNYRNGYKGIELKNKDDVRIFAFQVSEAAFVGDYDKYEFFNYNSNTWISLNYPAEGGTSNWDYDSGGIYTLSARKINTTQTQFLVKRNDGKQALNTVADSISSVQFYIGDTDSDLGQNNLYFNFLTGTNIYRI